MSQQSLSAAAILILADPDVIANLPQSEFLSDARIETLHADDIVIQVENFANSDTNLLVILPEERVSELSGMVPIDSLRILPFPKNAPDLVAHFLEQGAKLDTADIATSIKSIQDIQCSGGSLVFSESWSQSETAFHPDVTLKAETSAAYAGIRLYPSAEMVWRLDDSGDQVFNLNGVLSLKGEVIVTGGLDADARNSLYDALKCLAREVAFLQITEGRIMGITSPVVGAEYAVNALSMIFSADERNKCICGVGFSLHKRGRFFQGNTPLNGCVGNPAGSLFIELNDVQSGMRLRLFSTDTIVSSSEGVTLLGKKKMRRRKSAACPCLMF